jgi:hypothetical protein
VAVATALKKRYVPLFGSAVESGCPFVTSDAQMCELPDVSVEVPT